MNANNTAADRALQDAFPLWFDGVGLTEFLTVENIRQWIADAQGPPQWGPAQWS